MHSRLQSGWSGIILTLQVEERLTVGLDPSVHSDVSVLLLKCLFLSYSFNYEEQEVKDSRPSHTQTHTHTGLSENTTQTCTDTRVKCVILWHPILMLNQCRESGVWLSLKRTNDGLELNQFKNSHFVWNYTLHVEKETYRCDWSTNTHSYTYAQAYTPAFIKFHYPQRPSIDSKPANQGLPWHISTTNPKEQLQQKSWRLKNTVG